MVTKAVRYVKFNIEHARWIFTKLAAIINIYPSYVVCLVVSRRGDSVVLGSRSSKVPDWQEKSPKVDEDGYGWWSLFLLVWEGNLHPRAIPLTDGRPHSLSLFLSSFPLCSRKIMMFPGMTTKSSIASVSRHVQSVTGSEKIIALSSIYEYPTEYRVSSKCTTPSGTKVYFSTSSQEDSLVPLSVTWLLIPEDWRQHHIFLDLASNTYNNIFSNIVRLPIESRIKLPFLFL